MRGRFEQLSERRACELMGMARASHRYKKKGQALNDQLQEQLRELAFENPRYGYRRLQVLLRNRRQQTKEQRSEFNAKRIHRLYKKAGLSLRRVRRKRVKRAAVPLVQLAGPNQEWAMDFVHDYAANGQKLRLLAVVDEFTRECLTLVVDTSLPSLRVIRELEAVVQRRGAPRRLRMDNGSEMTSRQFLAWCTEKKIEMVHIQPGKPVQNAHSESFNGRMRDEFLNVNWFQHLWDARDKTASWLHKYNHERPHSSLAYRTPAEFAALWFSGPESVASASSPGLTARPSASGDSAPATDSFLEKHDYAIN